MKFMSRTPDNKNDSPAESTSGAGTNEAQDRDPQQKPKREANAADDRLGGAFAAVAQIVRAEMESLRQELTHRVESARQAQEKALAELTQQTRESMAGLKDQLQRAKDQTDNRTEEVRSDVQQMLTGAEQKLQKELNALTANLSTVRQDLQQQIATSGQVTSLLDNLAGVLTERPKPPAGSPPAVR